MQTKIVVENVLRPCKVKDQSGLFHRWSDKAEIIPPSPMIGGHGGGLVTAALGIVELEDGNVVEARPCDIRFLDGKVKEYCFEDVKEHMDRDQFEQWIYEDYTIGENSMARELLSNVLDYAEGMESAEQYDYLCRMIPQVSEAIIRTVSY